MFVHMVLKTIGKEEPIQNLCNRPNSEKKYVMPNPGEDEGISDDHIEKTESFVNSNQWEYCQVQDESEKSTCQNYRAM